jgi:hypothetical protein
LCIIYVHVSRRPAFFEEEKDSPIFFLVSSGDAFTVYDLNRQSSQSAILKKKNACGSTRLTGQI